MSTPQSIRTSSLDTQTPAHEYPRAERVPHTHQCDMAAGPGRICASTSSILFFSCIICGVVRARTVPPRVTTSAG